MPSWKRPRRLSTCPTHLYLAQACRILVTHTFTHTFTHTCIHTCNCIVPATHTHSDLHSQPCPTGPRGCALCPCSKHPGSHKSRAFPPVPWAQGPACLSQGETLPTWRGASERQLSGRGLTW